MSEDLSVAPSPATPPPASRRPPGLSLFFPLLLIIIGILLFLNTTGLLPWSIWWQLGALWPALLILIGVDIILRRSSAMVRLLAMLLLVALLVAAAVFLLRQPSQEDLRPIHREVALAGIRRGQVSIKMGAGRLTVEPLLSDTPNWAEVDLSGSAHEPSIRRDGERATLEIAQEDRPWWPGRRPEDIRWLVRLSPHLPLEEMEIEVGLGECNLDLGRFQVQKLTIHTGVGGCTITLPGGGEAGTVAVRIEGGVGSVHIIVPAGIAAQIEFDSGIGSVKVDESRFPKADDVYRSTDYAGASYRLQVEVDVGIGSIDVR